MKTIITTPQTIKFEIKNTIKKLDLDTLKREVKLAARSNAPGSVFLFTFGLDELEDRMDPIEYSEYENQIAELPCS